MTVMHTKFSKLLIFSLAVTSMLTGLRNAQASDPGKERFAHVEMIGHGKQALILVPCLGCDWRSFDQFMVRNAERYTIYAVTWPGLATSPLPTVEKGAETPYWDYILRAMANLIEEEGLQQPVILGHSAAGPYVVHFGHDYPDLVGKIINVDAIISNKDTLGYSRQQRIAWAEAEMADTLRQLDDEETWRNFNRRAAGGLGDRADFYAEMWLAPPRAHVFAYWLDWLKTDVGSMLPNLKVPLLSLYATGKTSEEEVAALVAAKEARYAANGRPPRATIQYIGDTGHTIWEYQPDAFDAAIADFVLSTAPE